MQMCKCHIPIHPYCVYADTCCSYCHYKWYSILRPAIWSPHQHLSQNGALLRHTDWEEGYCLKGGQASPPLERPMFLPDNNTHTRLALRPKSCGMCQSRRIMSLPTCLALGINSLSLPSNNVPCIPLTVLAEPQITSTMLFWTPDDMPQEAVTNSLWPHYPKRVSKIRMILCTVKLITVNKFGPLILQTWTKFCQSLYLLNPVLQIFI